MCGDQKKKKVAIVGSGPSGFYAAEELLNNDIQVDMFEKLSAPFGLVRYGVAPDHQKLKLSARMFEKTAQKTGFHFYGNVEVGKDITIADLQENYHAVILCHGASLGRKPGIPGENLKGCYTATEFVGWYNGHPDFQNLAVDLSCKAVAIIGHGNVSIDVARILAKPVPELAASDITSQAIKILSASHIEEIHVIGRRGPAQAKFTNQELRELGEIDGVDVIVNQEDMELNPASAEEIADKKNFIAAKNIELLCGYADKKPKDAQKKLIFHFLKNPLEVIGDDHVLAIRLAKNALSGAAYQQQATQSDDSEILPCGAVFFSIGYRGHSIPGINFDQRKSTYPNTFGKVAGERNLYTAGWIKRGPTGIIGTNKPCAQETVATLMADLANQDLDEKLGFSGIKNLLKNSPISFQQWQQLDTMEQERGKEKSKVREKFITAIECLEALQLRQ